MTEASAARRIRVAALARILAAEACGLVHDPLGQRLPDDLWRQREALAGDILRNRVTVSLKANAPLGYTEDIRAARGDMP